MSRAAAPQISFADLEFIHQRIHLEPTLRAIAGFLDTHASLVDGVRRDLERGLTHPATGRHGVTAPQVLRSLILMRVKNWDFRELRERIADGYTLRHFTQFESQPVPKHDAFNRAFNRLTPDTLRAINDAVVDAAVALGLEDGRKLRVDTTVVETDIHHPTDNTLLWDSVRVLTRLVRQLDDLLPRGVGPFTNRTRAARRRMQEIQRMTAKERHTQQLPTYRALIGIAEQVVKAARSVVARTQGRGTILTRVAAQAIQREISRHCELGDRVIGQTRRRVLHGEQVPTDEKVYSIFETHTDLIKRGKVLKPIEFGHKVFLAESGGGLITQYRVLTGNPADQIHVAPSRKHHTEIFGHAPDLYCSDRGFFNDANLDRCKEAGVTLTCIPQAGGGKRSAEREALEKSPAFKKGQRFRAGIEGRISVLFRGRGMKRALVEGRDRFELLVGAAVLANNLMKIADLLRQKRARRRPVAA
jgi:transposase, IS5 family